MTDLILIFMLAAIALLILLVIRFIQPQLIYSLRQVLARIDVNRAILEADEAEYSGDEALRRFQNATIKDIRYESPFYGDRYVMQRLKKISELYRILDHNSKSYSQLIDMEHSPQICVIELANLLDSLGRNLIPMREIDNRIVQSQDILIYLKERAETNGVTKKIDTEQNGDSLENWYIGNPMSIEQCIELLSAAAWALACRQSHTSVVRT